MEGIGQRIKYKRTLLKMSQEELALKVGYKSRSSINKIELDGRDLPADKIYAIAKALDTTPAFIMGWVEEPAEERLLAEFRQLSQTQQEIVFNIISTLKEGMK